jgi:hypothetical protein
VDTVNVPGRILLAFQHYWPPTRSQWDAVKITYTVGWQVRRPFVASKAYAVGDLVYPTTANLNGHFYKVTIAGTAAGTEPTWPTGGGATVVSGTVTFTEQGTRNQADEVPSALCQAILLLVSQMYEHRTPEVVGAVINPVQFAYDALIGPYRLARFGR